MGLYVGRHKLPATNTRAESFCPSAEHAQATNWVWVRNGWIGFGWDRGRGDTGHFSLCVSLGTVAEAQEAAAADRQITRVGRPAAKFDSLAERRKSPQSNGKYKARSSTPEATELGLKP